MRWLRSIFSASGRAGWLFYLFIRTSIRIFLFRYFRVRVVGREHLKTAGPLIIAPSHRSNLDAPLTGGVLDVRPHSLSKESLFKNPILAWIITALGSFPVKRGTADRESMRLAEKMLANGETLLVFPEGTRQSGPQIADIFDGTAYLAARGGASVIPLGISGTEDALPPGTKFPRRSTVTVVIGSPIPPPANEGRVRRRDLGSFTEQLSAGLQAALDEANRDAASR